MHLWRLQKHAFASRRIVILHTILGKNSYTLTNAGFRVFTYCYSAHISKKKTAIHLHMTASLDVLMYCDSYAT